MHSIDAAYFCARLSVCMSVTTITPAKTAEPIEMPLGVRSRVGPGNHVLGGGLDSVGEGKGQFLRGIFRLTMKYRVHPS